MDGIIHEPSVLPACWMELYEESTTVQATADFGGEALEKRICERMEYRTHWNDRSIVQH